MALFPDFLYSRFRCIGGRNKFIGRVMAAQIKDRFSALPQPNADLRIAAFTNRAGHIALDRGVKRKPIVGRVDIHFQQELSLRQADVVRTGARMRTPR